MWLFILFIVIPILEITLLMQIGTLIGVWTTVFLIIITAFLGTLLIRSQGRKAFLNIQMSLMGNGNPIDALAHGVFILCAGVFLLTPGFLTDIFGIMLLTPIFQNFLIRYIASKFFTITSSNTHNTSQDDTIIEGEYYEDTKDR